MSDRVGALLRAAAAAGHQHPLETAARTEVATFGHLPVPPTMRCQRCGAPLRLYAHPDDPDGAYVAHARPDDEGLDVFVGGGPRP